MKEFGQKMVTDHTRLGEQMKTVAASIGVTAPSGTSVGGMATMAELKLLSGDSFDKAYIKAMVKAHREDLQAFQNEASSGTSPAVRDAARKGAAVVQHHLTMAEQLAKSHNVGVEANRKDHRRSMRPKARTCLKRATRPGFIDNA